MNTYQFNPEMKPQPQHEDVLKERFLLCLAGCAIATDAALEMGCTVQVFYRYRREDKEFAKVWDEILREQGAALLEEQAFKRAVAGSDALLMFLMKAYNKDTFNERLAQANDADKGAVFKIVDAVKKPK